MELLIGFVIAFGVGFGTGAWAYRYLLKRDPATLDEIADKLRR